MPGTCAPRWWFDLAARPHALLWSVVCGRKFGVATVAGRLCGLHVGLSEDYRFDFPSVRGSVVIKGDMINSKMLIMINLLAGSPRDVILGTPPCTHVLWFFKRGAVAVGLPIVSRLENDLYRMTAGVQAVFLAFETSLKINNQKCAHIVAASGCHWVAMAFSHIFSTATGKPRPNNGLVLRVPPRSVSVLFANGKLNWKAPC